MRNSNFKLAVSTTIGNIADASANTTDSYSRAVVTIAGVL